MGRSKKENDYFKLDYLKTQEAYYQYLNHDFSQTRSPKQIPYLLKLNEAIDRKENTLIVKADLSKSKIIVNYDKYCEDMKKAKAFEIMKKYAKNDGWSNGWVIKFWEMNETELKLLNEVLGK